MNYGTIKFYLADRGWGFLTDDLTQDEFYFCSKNIKSGPIKKESKVSFELSKGPKGPRAIDVELI